MRAKCSAIWVYFNEVDGDTVRCNLCNQTYSRKGRGTSGLRSHLKSRHKTEYAEYEKCAEASKKAEVQKRQCTEEPSLQLVKRQALQESLMKDHCWDLSHEKSRELDKLICEMIALQDLPFNFVEGIGFRRFVHAAQPEYDLKEPHYYTSHLCNYIYPKLYLKIKNIIKDLQHVSFTTDIWTEPGADVSMLNFTVHGINDDFKRVSLLLKCLTLEERHTGDLVAQKLDEIREEWDIPRQKLHAIIIRDGGSNMRRAARIPQIDIDCTLHQIQLCIRSALASNEHFSTLLAKCKQISTHFNHTITGQKELNDFQECLGLPQLSVIQECDTRWNSMFYMIERLIKIKDAIILYTSLHPNLPQLVPSDWLKLENCAKILKPFEEVTKTLSSTDASISSVIPLIHVLTCTMQKHLREDNIGNDQDCKNVTQKLIGEINNRFGELHNNNLYAISTYLDPKYKTKFFNEITKERIELALLTEVSISTSQRPIDNVVMEADNQPSTSSGVYTSCPTAAASTGNTIDSMLAEMLASEPNSDDEFETLPEDKCLVLKSLLNNYVKEKRIHMHEDSLLWWKNNPKYSMLYGAVRQYLSSPPSSVPRERLFSNAGLVGITVR
ncbi:zinc finger BED domain-containing protein 4-like [Colias croceus]|uniref:zinc finger BED domain-containing protein 4-like n=1 Tax=Colias crocea TaxID=72248 RepID=UPI001E27C68B|nr:zinc finger BED domain-containing protein 4-like [Colias croceus]